MLNAKSVGIMMDLLEPFTSLGDLFVAGSTALVLVAWCWFYLGRRTALTFGICFMSVAALATVLKKWTGDVLVLPDVNQTNIFYLSSGAPSGHATLATMIYGSSIILFAASGRSAARVPGIIYCIACLSVVMYTRVADGAHTIADVTSGMVLAFIFVLRFNYVRRRATPSPTGGAGILLASVILVNVVTLASGFRFAHLGIV